MGLLYLYFSNKTNIHTISFIKEKFNSHTLTPRSSINDTAYGAVFIETGMGQSKKGTASDFVFQVSNVFTEEHRNLTNLTVLSDFF